MNGKYAYGRINWIARTFLRNWNFIDQLVEHSCLNVSKALLFLAIIAATLRDETTGSNATNVRRAVAVCKRREAENFPIAFATTSKGMREVGDGRMGPPNC